MDIPLLITIFILFVLIIISYSFKELDFVVISLTCCFVAATIIGLTKGIALRDFINFIDFEAIIIILSMSIIAKIAQDSNILEYLAIKLFKISKGNQRVFLYLICIITTLLSLVTANDFLVILIMAPIVIRLCRLLQIKAGTYLIGMTICVNIGCILTPFSSGENIIISSYFKLNTTYFIQYYWIFCFFLLFFTIFLIDRLFLKKEPKIEEAYKNNVLELINADIIISNKKLFYINTIVIIITIILFVILPFLYLTAAFSTFFLIIVNRKYTKKKMSDLLKEIEWEMLFFFISLYIIVGCLFEAGFKELFMIFEFEKLNPFLLYTLIFLLIVVLAGFIINPPIALIFAPIIQILIKNYGFSPIPLLFALIVGLAIGDNLIPQGSTSNMITLKIAQKSGLDDLNFKRLLKLGVFFTSIHIVLSIGYLFILTLLFG